MSSQCFQSGQLVRGDEDLPPDNPECIPLRGRP